MRRVTVAVEGLWRWPFRGGSSEQSYRSWVAATASWLLGGVDSARGVARPVQPVVPNGRPVIFEWLAAGPPRCAGRWSGAAPDGRDRTRSTSMERDGPRSGSSPASIGTGSRAVAAGRWRWRSTPTSCFPAPSPFDAHEARRSSLDGPDRGPRLALAVRHLRPGALAANGWRAGDSGFARTVVRIRAWPTAD